MTASAATRSPASAPAGAWPSSAYAWYATGLLMFSYFLGYVDRSIINLLIEPIKTDLGLSDTEISLIVGSSFAIFFAIAGIPLGRLADTSSRKWVITASVAAWSVMTAMCGLSRGFSALFASRVGVGVGEAGLNPSAMSLISDYFPRERRQTAITAYIVAGVMGAGFAMLIGAALLSVGEHLAATGAILPGLAPWQWVFLLVALPGLPLALLIALTVREQPRRDSNDALLGDNAKISIAEAISYYRERWRCFVPLLLGASIMLTVMVAFLVWSIPLAQRRFDLSPQNAAIMMGLPMFISGVFGNIIVSWFGKQISKRHTDGMMRAMLIVAIVAAGPIILAPLISEFLPFVLLLTPFMGMMAAMSALPQIIIQLIVPNRMRGQTVSLFYFVINIVSYSIGPTAVALLTDQVFADESKLHLSLIALSAVSFPIAIALFAWGLPHYRAEAERVLGKKAGA